jgi:hypothetical protein
MVHYIHIKTIFCQEFFFLCGFSDFNESIIKEYIREKVYSVTILQVRCCKVSYCNLHHENKLTNTYYNVLVCHKVLGRAYG